MDLMNDPYRAIALRHVVAREQAKEIAFLAVFGTPRSQIAERTAIGLDTIDLVVDDLTRYWGGVAVTRARLVELTTSTSGALDATTASLGAAYLRGKLAAFFMVADACAIARDSDSEALRLKGEVG